MTPNASGRLRFLWLFMAVFVPTMLIASAVTFGWWRYSSDRPPTSMLTAGPSASSSPRPSVVRSLHGRIAISAEGLIARGNRSCGPGANEGVWVTFPGGTYFVDESTVHPDEGCATSLTYDRVHSRWLRACVPWRNDGTIYLCNGMVVNADGSSYLVPRFTPYSYAVIGVEPEGLYLIFGEPPRWQSQGLMFVTYSGQETRMVTNYGFWNVAAFGFAYGTVTSSVPDGAANVVRRVDLKTGKTEDWFERRRLVSNVIGFTQTGTPIVFAGNSTKGEVWLAGHEPQLLYEADTSIDSFVATTAIGDDVGIWVETNRGLYLYTASAGWEFASGLSGRVASTFITSH